MRGNLAPIDGAPQLRRSIPACAGEPGLPTLRRHARPVYPRVCGGTGGGQQAQNEQNGLSPRVRGNQQASAGAGHPGGSIPACAGEPPRSMRTMRGHGVYPRVCGGTSLSPQPAPAVPGLSPRVRGNLTQANSGVQEHRSIPACAGEPKRSHLNKTIIRVYPRVCGGTIAWMWQKYKRRGLSPRVRGNPVTRVHPGTGEGSIPACAGEPASSSAASCPAGVYPRVCGGTLFSEGQQCCGEGLSPRVRGNPTARRRIRGA